MNEPPADTVRERLIDALREAGYDTVTAAEHVTRYLAEFRASGKRTATIMCGKRIFKLTQRAKP